MVELRSRRRTSKSVSTMDNEQVLPRERPSALAENDSLVNTAIYDLPSNSSSESPLELHKQSLCDPGCEPPQNADRPRRRRSPSFSASAESSPKKMNRRRSKRFRAESDGALNLQEALKLPIITRSSVTHADEGDRRRERSNVTLDRLQLEDRVDVEVSVTPTQTHVLKASTSTAPAKICGQKDPVCDQSPKKDTQRRKKVLLSRSPTNRIQADDNSETITETVVEGQTHEQCSRISPRSTSRSPTKGRLGGGSGGIISETSGEGQALEFLPEVLQGMTRISPRKHSEKMNTSSEVHASKLNNNPARTPQSARSVRFGNESLNAVHIIPSVATTVPFAEQMAKEREAEALEASNAVCEGGEEENYDGNMVPKCSRVIIGQRFIAVDRFCRKDECKYHFLTHAHVDHFVNLGKTWKTPIYCSELTAKLLPLMMGSRAVPSRLLRPLEMGKTHSIEPNLDVTVLDANHCLGAAMFLFEGASVPGGAILCTGDFRADDRFLSRFDSDPSFRRLANTYVSKIYFDNTHLNHREESFPDRKEAEIM
ncbi:hypothetical protein COOONC_01004, partial [Cooperia oncophora]